MTSQAIELADIMSSIQEFIELLKEELEILKGKKVSLLDELKDRRIFLVTRLAEYMQGLEHAELVYNRDEVPHLRDMLTHMSDEVRSLLHTGREEMEQIMVVQQTLLDVIKGILIEEKSKKSTYNKKGELECKESAKLKPADADYTLQIDKIL